MKLYRDSLSWSFELIKINMIKLKLKHTKSGKETILKWSYKSWRMLCFYFQIFLLVLGACK